MYDRSTGVYSEWCVECLDADEGEDLEEYWVWNVRGVKKCLGGVLEIIT